MMRLRFLLLYSLALGACGTGSEGDDLSPCADGVAACDNADCGVSPDCSGTDSGTDNETVDDDGDGVFFSQDCDDADANLGAIAEDGDCDGILKVDDCDDTDAGVTYCAITHAGGGTMIFIPPGTFDMGCTLGQSGCQDDEFPVHTVTLSHGFYLGETEVTQAQYLAVMGTNPTNFPDCGLDCPADFVTWHNTAEFANALSVTDGLTPCFNCLDGECSTAGDPYSCEGYRVPTEAEWEYAARAGEAYLYAGSDDVDEVAWIAQNSDLMSWPVAQKAPNAWGLYDMSGNLWEWTWDWHDPEYYASSPSLNPTGPESGTYRVGRGGCWDVRPADARVANRNPFDSSGRCNAGLGFRILRMSP